MQNLEEIKPKDKVKLTVPLVVTYLQKGFNRTQIAEMCNLDQSTVYAFCKRNYNQLAPLIDNSDTLMANIVKHQALKRIIKAEEVIDTTEDFDKRDLRTLDVGAAIFVDKYRLLEGKSTSNVNIDAVDKNIVELEDRERELMERLKKFK